MQQIYKKKRLSYTEVELFFKSAPINLPLTGFPPIYELLTIK